MNLRLSRHSSWPLVATLAGAAFLTTSAEAQPSSAPTGSTSSCQPPLAGPYDAEPTRPISLRAEIDFCFDLPEGDPRWGVCVNEAADTLEHGLRYQQCHWGLAPRGVQCSQRPTKPRNEPLARTLIERGCGLVGALRTAALDDSRRDDARSAVDDLHQAAAAAIRAERGTFSLVSQGGVSLGSWQAGYVYYLTEVLKKRRDQSPSAKASAFSTLTGASAGAINALTAGIEGCRATTAPEDSLFFRVWVDTLGLFRDAPGIGLFPSGQGGESPSCRNPEDRDPAASLGLFNTAPLCEAMKLARSRLAEPGLEECSFNYGFAVTHLHDVKEAVHLTDADPDAQTRKASIQASKLTEYFAFRVRPDERPSVTNLVIEQGGKPLTALLTPPIDPDQPLEQDKRILEEQRVDLFAFLDAVRASGAFPVAFPPVTLDYAVRDARTGRWTSNTADFVDGGTLDNTPIALAASINDAQRPAPPNPWLADLVTSPETYFFVNPNVVSWQNASPEVVRKAPARSTTRTVGRFVRGGVVRRTPERAAAPPPPEEDDLVDTYWAFGLDLLSTSADAQLVNATRQLDFLGTTDAALRAQLEVPTRHLPVAGAQFGHFMAFLERDFRVFDFYVGLVDGEEHLKQIPALEAHLDEVARHLQGIPEYACLRAYYDSEELRRRRRIDKTELPNCATAGINANFPRMLAAMHNYKRWMIESYDADRAFDQFFVELNDAGFEFRDVEKKFPPELFGSNPKYAFRRLIQDALNVLASKHGSSKGAVLQAAGQVVADSALTRLFPKHLVSIGYALNGLEAAYDLNVLARENFAARLTARGRLYRFSDRDIDQNTEAFGTVPSAFVGMTGVRGVPFVPPGILDLEVAGGLAYSTLWLPGRGDLALQQLGPSVRLGLSLLQRLYVGVDAEFFVDPVTWTYVAESYRGTEIEADKPSVRWNGSVGIRLPY